MTDSKYTLGMQLQMEAHFHNTRNRTEEEVFKHISFFGRLKDTPEVNFIAVDFAPIPDVQMEGFRILTADTVESFQGIVRCLITEGYIAQSPDLFVNEFGYLINVEGNPVELTLHGEIVSGSFIRRVEFQDKMITDLALYKKELPCV